MSNPLLRGLGLGVVDEMVRILGRVERIVDLGGSGVWWKFKVGLVMGTLAVDAQETMYRLRKDKNMTSGFS